MKGYPPFMNATGLVTRILDKIKIAETPDRFTQDFLGTKLGFTSGSARTFIPIAKRLGLLASDGSPTDLYKSFRNPLESKQAMASAMKKGYEELFSRNEYANDLDSKGLEGLLTEITGLGQGNKTLKAICGTFKAINSFSDFKAKTPPETKGKEKPKKEKTHLDDSDNQVSSVALSYMINLVLPKTDDISVFNAIFKSLKENLLRK